MSMCPSCQTRLSFCFVDTFQKALFAYSFLAPCVCPAWASGIEDTKIFQRVKVPYVREFPLIDGTGCVPKH